LQIVQWRKIGAFDTNYGNFSEKVDHDFQRQFRHFFCRKLVIIAKFMMAALTSVAVWPANRLRQETIVGSKPSCGIG
jgi:hypothetical protein